MAQDRPAEERLAEPGHGWWPLEAEGDVSLGGGGAGGGGGGGGDVSAASLQGAPSARVRTNQFPRASRQTWERNHISDEPAGDTFNLTAFCCRRNI